MGEDMIGIFKKLFGKADPGVVPSNRLVVLLEWAVRQLEYRFELCLLQSHFMAHITALLMAGILSLVGATVFAQSREAACDRGDYEACLYLAQNGSKLGQKKTGQILEDRGEFAAAAQWYLKAAQQGDRVAQALLGTLYYVGLGVPVDFEQAMSWFLKAAKQGQANAQLNLGFLYEVGQGVPVDLKLARFWFRKAAEQGSAEAQVKIARQYVRGQVVPRDLVAAAYWYRKAAEQGLPAAYVGIGELFAFGPPTIRDPRAARAWFEKAATAEQNDQNLCKANDCTEGVRYLGMAHEKGLGGAIDIAEATKLYKIASQLAPSMTLGSPYFPTTFEKQVWLRKKANIDQIVRPKHECRSAHLERPTFWPFVGSGKRLSREFDVDVEVEDESNWKMESIERQLTYTAELLAECGIWLRRAHFYKNKNCSYEDLSALHSRPRNESRVVISFQKRVGSEENYLAGVSIPNHLLVQISEAIQGNSDEKVTLAHELGHQLGQIDHPADFAPSLMHYGVAAEINPHFTAEQCSQLQKSGLMFLASGARSDRDIVDRPIPEELPASFQAIAFRGDRLIAAFYDLGKGFDAISLSSAVPAVVKRVAATYDLTSEEMVTVYGNYHLWRPEQGWPVKDEQLKKMNREDLFWLPQAKADELFGF